MARKNYISTLRVIAMFAVIAIHICSTAWSDFPDFDFTGGALYCSIISVFHFSVPVFFMITGALMLDTNRDMGIEKLLRKYIFKYTLVIVVFCWMFSFIEVFFETRVITTKVILSSFLNMIQGKSWAHMWYMYTLLGMMFLVPILRFVARYADKKTIDFILISGIVFLSIVPTFEAYTEFKIGVVFPVSIIYPLYMLLGYWVDKEICKLKRKNCIFIFVSCLFALIALSVLQQHFNYSRMYAAYNSPLILLFAVCIFGLIRNSVFRENKLILELDKLSFGVYIIHMFWINLAYKFLKINPLTFSNPLVGLLGLFIAVSCLSIISSYIMKRIPFINKII